MANKSKNYTICFLVYFLKLLVLLSLLLLGTQKPAGCGDLKGYTQQGPEGPSKRRVRREELRMYASSGNVCPRELSMQAIYQTLCIQGEWIPTYMKASYVNQSLCQKHSLFTFCTISLLSLSVSHSMVVQKDFSKRNEIYSFLSKSFLLKL